jgi:hypothetical protein
VFKCRTFNLHYFKIIYKLHFFQKEKSMTKTIEFEEALNDDDWGLIISNDGKLKGLFIPDGKDEEEVPLEILMLCKKHFGIDVRRDEYAETLH